MKKVTKRIAGYLLICAEAITICSCSADNLNITSEEKNIIETTNPNDQELNSLFMAIDSINNAFVPPAQTRKGTVEKYGPKVLSAAVDGTVGFVAGAASGPLGGFLIGTAASWAFDAHWEYLNKKANRTRSTDDTNNQRTDPPTCMAFADKDSPSLKDSLGYIHNQVLADLSAKNTNYINNDETINYDLLLNDCAKILKQYNINCDEIIANKSDKKDYISTLNFTVNSFIAFGEGKLDIKECFNYIENFTLQKYGNKTECIVFIKEIEKKLMEAIPELSKDQIYDYAESLNNTINESTVSKEQKEAIKTTCDITINSALYWKEENKQ